VSEESKNAGGEPIWDVIARHLRDVKTVKAVKLNEPIIKGVKGNPGMAAI
jgi:sulfur-oxidizing protein SoxB